jgi:vitamin B12 transporter
MERTENRIAGTIPINPNVLDTAAPRYRLDEDYAATRSGGYLETEMRVAPEIVVGTGLRADHSSANGRVTFDPRLSLRYQFAEGADIRLAWGIYHQTPLPYQLNATSGNPDLRSQRSEHRIAGVEYATGDLTARLELYDKIYHDLILRDSALHLANRGEGSARGVDLFIKYGAFLETRFNGWLSYSFLSSRRTQPRDRGVELTYEEAPSPFDITHNLVIVGKYRLVGYLNIGIGARYATGAPVTPITGAIFDSTRGTYTPIEGAIGSERLPSYIRLDCDLSYQLPFADDASAIFYLGITNLLDRSNVLGYSYSNDYSTRTPRRTNFNRSTYFGATVTIAL